MHAVTVTNLQPDRIDVYGNPVPLWLAECRCGVWQSESYGRVAQQVRVAHPNEAYELRRE